jgi:hypothetical protein
MSDDRYVNPLDLFRMTVSDFVNVWGLTPEEIKREGAAGRLQMVGRKVGPMSWVDCCFMYPAIRKWLARKYKMPARIRAKVEAAGGLDRLQRFVRDQLDLCTFDLEENTMTLPDGEVLDDIRFSRDEVLSRWPVKH